MKCPACSSGNVNKVIASALPMKFCNSCNTLWGEPWASIYTWCFAPIEAYFNDGFTFFFYKGSYFKALWQWLRG